ncbi:MAG TPA: hypothetical protein VEL03_10640 [Streptosporangiaceae bacterium]|nr:hypothetical protein [Streptosporangiaceae bacterium]
MRSHTATTSPAAEISGEEPAVHAWRIRQLTGLGLALQVAEAVADQVDWHDVARLVQRGCPVALAVVIAG